MEYVLASASPRRRELMGLIVPDFRVFPTDVDESLREGKSLYEESQRLAEQKALAAVLCNPGAVVIGSDTLVTIDGLPLGKPVNNEDAGRMLRLLSGRTHEVLTSVAVVTPAGEVHSVLNVTRVSFYALTDAEIDRYILSGEPMDKAGAYGIQGKGSLLVKSIEGDFFAVMGLPVAQTYRLLREYSLI